MLTLASDKVNALDREVLDEVTACVDRCEQDAEIGALIVTGEGSLFSAGVNVKDVLEYDKAHTEELLSALSTAIVGLFAAPLRDLVGVLDARVKQLESEDQ